MALENSEASVRRFSRKGLVRSGLWVAADNGSQQVLQFLCFFFVGNIIGPSAVGLMTIALTYMMLMHALLMNAFTNVIVQREDVTAEHYNTAFWINAGLGVVAMIASALIAPAVAWSLGEPEVAPLIRALSPLCLAMGMISFFEARIRRALRFNRLAGRSIVSVGSGFAVAIVMAMKGYGVWSLIAYQLVWRFVELVFLAVLARWRPSGFISRRHLSDMLDFSLHSMALRLTDFFAQNVGRILIGYMLGMNALGIYQLARRFVEAPLNALSGMVQGLTLPIFSRLQKDPPALAETVATSVQLASFLMFPAFAGLFLVAPSIIAAFLKPEWQPAGALVQAFCVMGILMSITYFLGSALVAFGQAKLAFRIAAGLLVVRVILLASMASFGLMGIALAEVTAMVVGIACWYAGLARYVPVRLTQIATRIAPIALATAAMVAAVLLFRNVMASHLTPLEHLGASIVIGVAVFIGGVLLTSMKDLAGLRKFVSQGV